MIKDILYLGKARLWSGFKYQLTKDHPLLYLFWECTLRCNFFCQHCGSNAGNNIYTDELSTHEIKKGLQELAQDFDAKKIMLAVTGGEPLLRKDVFEVMKFAHSLGFEWGMVTNGFLVNQKVVAQMKDSGMSTVVVSIDGLNKVHDKFRGVDGAYEKAVAAVKLLAQANFLKDLQITTTVHPGNIDQLEAMYNVFEPLGIDSWRVINTDPIGRAEDNESILLKPAQLKKLLDFIKDKRRKTKIDIIYGCAGFLGPEYEGQVRKSLFFCRAGVTIGSILYNGDIFVCPNVPRVAELIQGNIKRDRLSDVWNNKFKFFRDINRTSCSECKQCEYWDDCRGGSLHIWDFKKQEPKLCHLDLLTTHIKK